MSPRYPSWDPRHPSAPKTLKNTTFEQWWRASNHAAAKLNLPPQPFGEAPDAYDMGHSPETFAAEIAATLPDPDDALTVVEIRPVAYDSGYRAPPTRTDAEIAEAEAFFVTFRLNAESTTPTR